MQKMFSKEIIKNIKRANRVALFCHVSPDVDALGSMYGLYFGLKSLGKNVKMFNHENISYEKKMIFDENLAQIGNFEPEKFDLLISVDASTSDRLGIYKDDFFSHPNTIKIDHHRVGNDFAKLTFVDYSQSSCCEIIYKLLNNLRVSITPNIATFLYAGLSSDTSSFVNTNTNLSSFETAKKLYELNADIGKVNDALHRNISLAELRMKQFLYSNLEIIDNEIALILVTKENLDRLNASKQDCDNHSSELISIQDINISCAIIESQPNLFNCSFRSMEGFNVSLIAQRLGGGGHVCAAGCKLECKNGEEARGLVLDAIKKYLKSRN